MGRYGMNCARWPVSRVLSPPDAGDDHSSGTLVAERLTRPTRTTTRKRAWPACAGPSSLLGLAPGGVCPAIPVTGNAVRSYRTLSPLPRFGRGALPWRFAFCGTVPGVAPAGRYPAPYFRGARTFLASLPKRGHPAIWRRRVVYRVSTGRATAWAHPFCRHGRSPAIASNAASRPTVSASATPSKRAGRKWRWKATSAGLGSFGSTA